MKGHMDAAQYCDILSESLFGALDDYNKTQSAILYQQDNDLKQTLKHAQAWFQEHGFQLASHPAQSPDMNPIKHAWDMVDQKLHSRFSRPMNLNQLWHTLKEEWVNLDVGYIWSLYESMPQCTATLLEVKGGHTRY